MRIKKELIERIASKIVKPLVDQDMIIWEDRPEKQEAIDNHIITEDLMVEDRLNDEVKMLLESRTNDFERELMDFGRAFQMV